MLRLCDSLSTGMDESRFLYSDWLWKGTYLPVQLLCLARC